MNETHETLQAHVRQMPLVERLARADEILTAMWHEGRPPRRCVPVQWDDEDIFIGVTLDDAKAAIAERDDLLRLAADALSALLSKGLDGISHEAWESARHLPQRIRAIVGEAAQREDDDANR